jgi:hypothetical protein
MQCGNAVKGIKWPDKAMMQFKHNGFFHLSLSLEQIYYRSHSFKSSSVAYHNIRMLWLAQGS